MLIYLFTIDGKPGFRTELHMAQAALEDKLRDRRDVSDVWWNDKNPYIPRVYLYGGSHSDYEANEAAGVDAMEGNISWEEEDQLIFPVEVGEVAPPAASLDQLGPVIVQLSTTVSSREGTRTITRGFSESNWPTDAKGKADRLKSFNRDVEWALINEWINKERS